MSKGSRGFILLSVAVHISEISLLKFSIIFKENTTFKKSIILITQFHICFRKNFHLMQAQACQLMILVSGKMRKILKKNLTVL